jgi:peptidoglycan/LPS O-acetylase OafA/YrhL
MRIVALDVIRFYAALSVVLYHYISRPESEVYPIVSEFTKYGYLGVPLFFIISGYVVSLSAKNRTAIQFGVSRFVRLYPALWAGVIFTVFCVTLFSDARFTIWQILSNFTLLNEYLGFEDIDGVYWTLKAELKFYACIFFLLLFGFFQKYRYWLSFWLGLTAIHAISGQPFFMGWFITPEYSSFFIGGVACFLIQTNGITLFNLFIFLASLIISSFKAFSQTQGFIMDPSVLEKSISVAAICLFYLILFLLCTGKINLTERKALITIGALTYPLYLIHNIAGKTIINNYTKALPESLLIIIVIGFMLLCSFLINIGIEKQLASPMKNFLLSKLNRA